MGSEIAQRRPSQDIPCSTHGLWSLWDIMHRFRASSYGAAMGALTRTAAAIFTADTFGVVKDTPADREMVRNTINEAEQLLADLPLSKVLRSQFERIKKSIDRADGMELTILLREYWNNITVELSSAWFLMIPAESREYYEQHNPPFGEKVAAIFGTASADICAASRCFALDEWTACVFHLMRVLEHGLKRLAKQVGLPSEALEQENWKNIIDQIERKIRELENLPKNADKSARTQFLSEAATQFRYFKDAWRNHVSHAHSSYDQHSGPPVWTHVKAFMQHMASHADEGAI